MKNFLEKNKVIVIAFLSAITLVLQQAMQSGETSWKAIGFAALIGLLGVAANQFKGKGITILGILGTLAGVFHTIWATGSFTWNEFILSAIIAILTAVTGSLQPSTDTQQETKNEPYLGRSNLNNA